MVGTFFIFLPVFFRETAGLIIISIMSADIIQNTFEESRYELLS